MPTAVWNWGKNDLNFDLKNVTIKSLQTKMRMEDNYDNNRLYKYLNYPYLNILFNKSWGDAQSKSAKFLSYFLFIHLFYKSVQYCSLNSVLAKLLYFVFILGIQDSYRLDTTDAVTSIKLTPKQKLYICSTIEKPEDIKKNIIKPT